MGTTAATTKEVAAVPGSPSSSRRAEGPSSRGISRPKRLATEREGLGRQAQATTRTLRRRTQAERRAVAMQRMIDAAILVLGQKGYQGTTLAEIGQVAGYSRGLAHHYFGSKLELIRAVEVEMHARFRRGILRPPPAGQHGLDAVLTFIDDYLSHMAGLGPQQSRTVFVLLFESLAVAPELKPVVAEMSGMMLAQISARIRQGIADGTIRPDLDPDTQALLIAAMLRGAIHEWILDPARVDLDVVAAEIQAMLRSRLAAPPQAGTA